VKVNHPRDQLTEMEVVVLCVSNESKCDHDVQKCCCPLARAFHFISFYTTQGFLTKCGCFGSHVTGLVTSQKSLCLDLGCWSTGEFLVEADNPLHAYGVLCSPDALLFISFYSLYVSPVFDERCVMVVRVKLTVLLCRRIWRIWELASRLMTGEDRINVTYTRRGNLAYGISRWSQLMA
jgi:hypothetical protein